MRTPLPYKNFGFSLVEMVVVIAIMGVMTAAGATYIGNMNGRQDLAGAADEIVSDLKLARNLATSQQRPSGFSDSVTVVNVVFGTSGGKSVISAYPNSSPASTYFSNVYDDDGSVSVVPVYPAGVTQILFTAYEGKLATGTSGVPMAYNQNIRIGVSAVGVSTTRTIIVSANGSISE